MPHSSVDNLIATSRNSKLSASIPFQPHFAGFKAPTSNTTYTPNQFFDVCVPNFSRGVVRIVAYLIRKTLGWCDSHGNPQEEQIEASYSELVDKAGVSRDMIRQALDDAIKGGLIECVREGRPKVAHDAGQSGLYQLRWDATSGYKVRLTEFSGFFEGEGNRTDIPNEFFDVVIPHEPLSVIKVVGSIIRHSIGFQAKHGRRRQLVALSYQQIQNYARFGSRSDLAKALRIALERNYIVRIEEGVFSPFRRQRHSATYAIRWYDNPIGQKITPALEQSENQTSFGQIPAPANRSENRSSIKTKPEKETVKQPAMAAAHQPGFEKLKEIGFSEKVAAKLAAERPLEEIEQQISWLPQRTPARRPLGMLRTAIEEGWPAPAKLRLAEVGHERGHEFARFFYAAFGGSQSEPVNQPSAHEAEVADEFVKRLLGANGDVTLIPEWGRALGRAAREQRNPFPSLSLAIRQSGDAMLARLQRETEEVSRAAREQARLEHENKNQPAYQAFLRGREQELQASQSEDYERFNAKRAQERADLSRKPTVWSRSLLESFDLEVARLGALREFFNLPDFWQWDRAFNPECLQNKP